MMPRRDFTVVLALPPGFCPWWWSLQDPLQWELMGWFGTRRRHRGNKAAHARGHNAEGTQGRTHIAAGSQPTAPFSEAATARKLAELTRSRRAVAEAYERERRRIERDLHDGAQQYFVAASMALGRAQAQLNRANARPATSRPNPQACLERAQDLLDRGLQELRRTVHGINPAELREFGLIAAIENAAQVYEGAVKVRCPFPLPHLDASVLAAAYFFTTEALTNAAKHAPNTPVSVLVTCEAKLRISVIDGGVGEAWFLPGGGLCEMRDRLSAFDGTIVISSPRGGPTQVVATIPTMLARGESGLPGTARDKAEEQ